MRRTQNLYSSIYDSDYTIANLVEVADKIRMEQQSVLSKMSIKKLIDMNNTTNNIALS